MVGIFARFSGSRNGHRRTQSALDLRHVSPPNAVDTGAPRGAVNVVHGIEMVIEFKPLEHPAEPLDNDQPIQCPFPEPSILSDGRTWKERVFAGEKRGTDLEENSPTEPEAAETKQPLLPSGSQKNRLILPSISAPEHSLHKLLEDSNSSGV